MTEIPKNQSLARLHEKRKLVVELHQKHMGVMQIVLLSGLSYQAVRACINLFEAGGLPAIQPALRGRRQGKGRILTPEQETKLLSTLTNFHESRRRPG